VISTFSRRQEAGFQEDRQRSSGTAEEAIECRRLLRTEVLPWDHCLLVGGEDQIVKRHKLMRRMGGVGSLNKERIMSEEGLRFGGKDIEPIKR
jgi:hypothetical protein